ncbi:hypothetical protein QYE76_016521 [Lolium multiflorum]|uniref:Myb-like domain-containing protein n=1 Tax=Lolium multiflorum TaxID=4521 RepID=A0AAD8VFR3_LOLMU|nr:hypothetical protein QYE76_016521 [Lolium multiflorum]
MSARITVTYKRKRGASKARADDGVVPEPPPVSGGEVAGGEASKHESTSTKQHDACKSTQQSAEKETAKPCAHPSEKEQKEIQLSGSLPQAERPEIFCATSLPIAEASNDKLQCSNDAFNPIPSPSYACDLRHDDGTNNQAEDSNNSAPARISYHQAPDDTARHSQCKDRFSPLLTFRRRVKRKINLDESAEEDYSKDNGKGCSTLTCSPPSFLVSDAPLLKETGGNSLDTAYKMTITGTSTGLKVPSQGLLEQKSSYMQHTVSQQNAEDVNQSLTSERDGTLVSEFTSVPEISKQDVRAEDLSKTLHHVTEAPDVVEMKELHDGPLESEGSTKHIPVIVLDGDNDERGKLQENPKVSDQVVQENKKGEFTSGKINLNCVESPEESPLDLNDSSVQRNQDHFATEQKHVSQPIERLFFTKEKDTIHAKEKHQEGTSTLHTLYSNFFDPTPSQKAGSSKEPKNMPSELKFRIMDKVPEFSLDLSLDGFQDSGMSTLGHNKLFHGGKSSGSHLLTERLGTYSYKRRQAPWSEEELDFLWIGVRRYGTNNWNAMMRDTRLQFSSSRVPEDLAKQWDKEQKKLLGVDLHQSIRTSALGSAPPLHIAEDYVGNSSCSGCSKSPFLAAQTNLSMGDVYLRNARASDRGQHHLSNLGRYNLHGIDNGLRNSSLGSFPVASSSHGKSGTRRRKTSKLHKSYYDNRSHWCQEVPDRMSQVFPMNQQPINSLPQWLTKDVKTSTSWLNPEMWPNTQAPCHSAADSLNDSLRAAAFLFPDEKKPHVMPDAPLKRTLKRKVELHSLDKKVFQTGGDTMDLYQRAAAMAAGLNGATASNTGASSEETLSDS